MLMQQVTVARDGWDVVVLVVGIAAGISATIGFCYWILAQRRRPEVAFLWQVSESGTSDRMDPWPQEHKPEIRPGATIVVEASIQNVGDATAERALVNFVVPECFALERVDGTSSAAMTSANPTAGHAPAFRVHFIGIKTLLYPTMWLQLRFTLTLKHVPHNQPGARLLLELSDDRLNGRGSRWFPSLPAPVDLPTYSILEPWPIKLRLRRDWRRIKVGHLGTDNVMCYPGGRQTTRDVQFAP
jgi:hypothetical protein